MALLTHKVHLLPGTRRSDFLGGAPRRQKTSGAQPSRTFFIFFESHASVIPLNRLHAPLDQGLILGIGDT